MKGRNRFTEREIARLQELIEEKVVATPSAQKRIRAKIRNIGFYWSDFSDKKGYTLADFNSLIRTRQILINNITERKSSNDPTQSIYKQYIDPNSLTSKRNKPIIVDKVSDLLNPHFGLDPVVDNNIKVLICGTFPAKESIDAGYYYQNQIRRFWGQALKVVGPLEELENDSRNKLLLKNRIGLWDIFECIERESGNQDTSIKKAKYNSFENFLRKYPNIDYLVFNSKNAHDWFCQDHPNFTENKDVKIVRLQSSSGSNGWFRKGKDWKEFFVSIGIENS